MAKSATLDQDFLALLYNGTAIANIADNAATSPNTDIYLALHTADPTAAGNQASSEVAYTGYARVAVARDNTGFVVNSGTVTLAADQLFTTAPASGVTTQVATYFSTGKAGTGTGEILHSGTIAPAITITNGVQPKLTNATKITET